MDDSVTGSVSGEVRARIPADVDAPDRVLFGFTARQVAVLVAVAAPAYLAWRAVDGRVPDQVLLAAGAPVAALAVALAVGRRDGIALDGWLAAAVSHLRQPHRLVPAPDPVLDSVLDSALDLRGQPVWSPTTTPSQPWPHPAPLRLPAEAIGADGVIELGDATAVAVVATTTVNTGLLAGSEQAALVQTYGRWLNSLTGPVQVAISSRRVDLGTHALRTIERSGQLPSSALRNAAIAYAQFLLDLTDDRDPLARTVTIACTAGGADVRAGAGGGRPGAGSRTLRLTKGRTRGTAGARPSSQTAVGVEAGRRAARTAQTLAGLGVRAEVLDGAAVTALLAAAVDPYTPGDAGWPRTPPESTVTGPDTTWADEAGSDPW